MECKCEQTSNINLKTEKSTRYDALIRAFNVLGQHCAETAENLPAESNETRQIFQNEQLTAEYWRSIAILQTRQHVIT
jgi:hypothetical protein